MIDYTQPPLGYLVRVPQADQELDAPLDAGARARAEEAARFLSFTPIGQIVSSGSPGAIWAAQIICDACVTEYQPEVDLLLKETIPAYLGLVLPCVLVCRQAEI